MSIYDNINEYVGKIGYVPQNQNMFPYFTGYKFMMYMATLKGVKKEVARKQIPELLKCVNMEVMGKQKIKTQRACDALANEARHRPLLL